MIRKDCIHLHNDNGSDECEFLYPDILTNCDGCVYGYERKTTVKLEGVSPDEEIVTNEKGGKQSKSPMALHLVDPDFLDYLTERLFSKYQEVIRYIVQFEKTGDKLKLYQALLALCPDQYKCVISIAKTLQEGASRYAANNWRLIPQEEHINHALIHILALEMGDEQDNHYEHTLTRLMMAIATKPSDNFSFTEYKGE